eukprot:NODE_213_length_12556_cov_0.937063.p11 type:complete len:161 gc:universal NODE_213_length_12556_cov_0.937063:6684-7166(+)
MTKEVQLASVNLYGEAITMKIPKQYYSIAQIRQVPDNQEVYVYEDDSIIIELLECAEKNTATEAISFHFDVIKEDNEATDSKVDLLEEIAVPIIEQGGFGAVLIGHQVVNEKEIEMGIVMLRIHNVETDIVITWHSKEVSRDVLMQFAESMVINDWNLFQ